MLEDILDEFPKYNLRFVEVIAHADYTFFIFFRKNNRALNRINIRRTNK